MTIAERTMLDRATPRGGRTLPIALGLGPGATGEQGPSSSSPSAID